MINTNGLKHVHATSQSILSHSRNDMKTNILINKNANAMLINYVKTFYNANTNTNALKEQRNMSTLIRRLHDFSLINHIMIHL
jgi:hypothetical protein